MGQFPACPPAQPGKQHSCMILQRLWLTSRSMLQVGYIYFRFLCASPCASLPKHRIILCLHMWCRQANACSVAWRSRQEMQHVLQQLLPATSKAAALHPILL